MSINRCGENRIFITLFSDVLWHAFCGTDTLGFLSSVHFFCCCCVCYNLCFMRNVLCFYSNRKLLSVSNQSPWGIQYSQWVVNVMTLNILLKKSETYLICFRIELILKNSTKNEVHQISFCIWFRSKFMILTLLSVKKTLQWGWGAADAEIKVPSGESTELKHSPFKAWSRSVYGHTCYVYCQGFLPW